MRKENEALRAQINQLEAGRRQRDKGGGQNVLKVNSFTKGSVNFSSLMDSIKCRSVQQPVESRTNRRRPAFPALNCARHRWLFLRNKRSHNPGLS